MTVFFPEIQNKLGFGFMRLPMEGEHIDIPAASAMVDAFLDAGFNYFDTAHGYHSGQSETALRECLTSRYPRERYILTNKLTDDYFKTQADIRPLFESQLLACGVEYFDFYLMHALNDVRFAYYKERRAFETVLELKAEGKLRHFGISFHDRAEVLRQILTEYPQIEVVQIQFNYADYESTAVDSRWVYETCVELNKPVIVMEPVKGGSLAKLPGDAAAIFRKLGGSPASYAIRFAAGFGNVVSVLSGMSDLEQVKENTGFMRDFRPLNEDERAAVSNVCKIFRSRHLIPCTGCRYCVDGCPQRIPIPELFACMNAKKLYDDWNQDYYYGEVLTVKGGKASSCIKCGKCEHACPQRLNIRELLEQVADTFEKK